jgi:hypothetical protein
MTAITPKNTPDLLQLSYEIGKHIQGALKDETYSNLQLSSCTFDFPDGPNAGCAQTKNGLILEVYYGMPSFIHTPYGRWKILGNGSGAWQPVIEALKSSLDLEKISKVPDKNKYGQLWAIRKWNNIRLDPPFFCSKQERTSVKKVAQVWSAFVAKHPDLQHKK